jgi:hypothetical protein
LLTLRLGLRAGAGGAPAELGAPALHAVREATGVVAVHLLEARPDVTSVATEEKRLRGPGDREAVEPWCILVEADDAGVLAALRAADLDAEHVAAHGLEAGTAGAYRLQISIDRERGDSAWR